MAAQALMPWLSQDAEKRMLAGKRIDPAPTSEQGLPATQPGSAADHAARLSGVGHSLIYEAQKLAKQAQTDPQAAELARQVTEGSMSVYQANRTLGIASPSRGGEVASQERETRTPATTL